MIKKIFYFAYGSNLNLKKMVDLGCTISFLRAAELRDYELVFNKRSYKDPNVGFANIVRSDKKVEGILYEILEEDLLKLDKIEGCPKHYHRRRIEVICDARHYNAITYCATEEWIDENVRPTKKYLDNLMKAKSLLSKDYGDMLDRIYEVCDFESSN